MYRLGDHGEPADALRRVVLLQDGAAPVQEQHAVHGRDGRGRARAGGGLADPAAARPSAGRRADPAAGDDLNGRTTPEGITQVAVDLYVNGARIGRDNCLRQTGVCTRA